MMIQRRAVWSLVAVAAGVGAMAGAAQGGSSGADVIVGDIFNNAVYNIDQVDIDNGLGNRRAYAIGTLSCNRGDVPFSWRTGFEDQENRHPVIGQNFFRISQGRIEHIGQAFLKHGYVSLNSAQCAGTPGFPHTQCFYEGLDGEYLGVGCSDPYDATLNGLQSDLGPKWQVDAAHGLFPFPYADPPFDGFIPRRLNIDINKLSDTAAVFLVEGQYIGFDDASTGHDNNNASWRRVIMDTPPGWNMSLTDSTVREQPAIYAWRVHAGGVNVPDNTITISPLDVPNDGRLIMGVRVTQVTGTTWRYTYAVQNLNSSRSGRSITIPFPSGTMISNVFYNEPGYHSGEPNEGQPAWTLSQTGTSISWSGPAHTGNVPVYTLENNPADPGHVLSFTPGTGNDHSANALRWGTMYTFGFDASVGPAQGTVSMGLFRPGSAGGGDPNAVTWAVRTPGGALTGMAPGNDLCAAAFPIQADVTAFSTGGATTDGPIACDGSPIDHDVWFSYTAGCSGQTTITTCGSEFDTKLAIYPGGQCPPTQASMIACNDNNTGGGCAAAGDSSVTFDVTMGASYLVRVGSHAGAPGGNGVLNLQSCPTAGACCTLNGICTITTAALCTNTFLGLGTACIPNPCRVVPPGNDQCANALPLCDGQSVGGSTLNADQDGTASCGPSSASPSVWYSYTPAKTGAVTVSLCDEATDYDTAFTIWSGACPGQTELICNDDSSCEFNNGTLSEATINMTAGTRYLIRVAGYNGNSGNFRIRVTGGGGMGCSQLINDNCQGRIGVGTGTIPFTTIGATTDGPMHAACSNFSYAQIDKDIWYNFPLAINGSLSVDTCVADFDTRLAIYETTDALCSSINDSTLIGCNDDSTTCGSTSSHSALTVPTVVGKYYIIRVGGYEGQSGSGELHISISTNQTGACCTGFTCAILGSATCATSGGSFKGPGTTCQGTAANPITCCPANFDKLNGVDVADLFGYINAWLAKTANADFDSSGTIDVADLFGYINAWLVKC